MIARVVCGSAANESLTRLDGLMDGEFNQPRLSAIALQENESVLELAYQNLRGELIELNLVTKSNHDCLPLA